MGAQQSTQAEPTQKEGVIFYNENTQVPIRFSTNLVSELSAKQKKENQPTPKDLEEQLRNRVKIETERLKAQEEEVLKEIESKLEKENLNKSSGKDSLPLSALTLEKDLEAVSAKVKRLNERKDIQKSVEESQKALVACFNTNADKPLDCYKEVETFKSRVAGLEKDFVATLS